MLHLVIVIGVIIAVLLLVMLYLLHAAPRMSCRYTNPELPPCYKCAYRANCREDGRLREK